ncbi:MAG: hypothetical protein J2P17_09290 [Mycobacterium sp.]|nr:hypothetical protein [Mycobacterium sp.]
MRLHVIVEFPTLPPLHFCAEESVARAFRSEMRRWHTRALVRVDQTVSAGMRLLPCHRLFEEP